MGKMEDRKMCAEFAGSKTLAVNDPANLEGELWIIDGRGLQSWCPHYESDPAAACSLLPKLAEALWCVKIEVDPMNIGGELRMLGWFDLMGWIAEHLAGGDDTGRDRACRLIVQAVRASKGE